MPATHDPRQNQLLAALPSADLQRWTKHLQWTPLAHGDVLRELSGPLEYVYFPTTAVIALVCELADGASNEIAMVGNDGVLGVALFMGGNSISRAVVTTPGAAFRMQRSAINAEFMHSPATMRILLRYTQSLMTQITQTVVCNRFHSIEQQLCRWLLQMLDRQPSRDILLTHEGIAALLGVRREGVTEHAFMLQQAGFIRYSRGHIKVLDRAGLEKRACECYDVVRKETDRLLPQRQAA